MKISLFILFIYCFVSTLFGQNNDTPSSSYYVSYSDSLTARTYGIRKFTEVAYEGLGEKVLFKSNDNFNLGVGVNYRWLGLNLAFNFPFINRDDAIYGSTQAFDLQGNFYGRKNVIDVNIHAYNGYYRANPTSLRTSSDEPFPIRGDLQTANIAIDGVHVFNHEKFSYRAAFVQNERQLKSAGSWLLGGYFNIYGMESIDSTTILPTLFLSNYSDTSLYAQSISSFQLGLLGGYAHTFVVKSKWFFSITATIGIGARSVERSLASGEVYTANEGGAYGNTRLAVGYNKDKSFFGITSVFNTLNLKIDKDLDLEYRSGAVRIIYARRFSLK